MSAAEQIRECREGAIRNAKRAEDEIIFSRRFASIVFAVAIFSFGLATFLTSKNGWRGAFLFILPVVFTIQGFYIINIGMKLALDFLKMRQDFLDTSKKLEERM